MENKDLHFAFRSLVTGWEDKKIGKPDEIISSRNQSSKWWFENFWLNVFTVKFCISEGLGQNSY